MPPPFVSADLEHNVAKCIQISFGADSISFLKDLMSVT